MRLENLNESNLSTKERNGLGDRSFGIPETRSYPLNDEDHVLAAIRMFNRLRDKTMEPELAKNIIRAAKRFGMVNDIRVGKDNRFLRYWNARNS